MRDYRVRALNHFSESAVWMLIEIRVAGGKHKLKQLIRQVLISSNLRVKKVIPHISIYEPAYCKVGLGEIIQEISGICKDYDSIPFLIDGFDHKINTKGKKVIALRIRPSTELEEIRDRLAGSLSEKCPSQQPWDNGVELPWFHITIANKLSEGAFRRCWGTISEPARGSFFERISAFFGLKRRKKSNFQERAYIPMNGIRLTILNERRKIAAEYDFAQKRMLTRNEALDRRVWARTLKILRQKTGCELTKPSFKQNRSIFLFSDLHLDHENIIKYCGRPFADISDMNDVLVRNWNYTVREDDQIYFLGDLVFGKGARKPEFWLPKLNGVKTFITGSHDPNSVKCKDHVVLSHKGHEFLLVHDPDDLPIKWEGWIIHGHKHNNNLRKYPFINGERRTINVSAEVLNYKPICIDDILALNLNSISRADTIDSKIVRK